MTDYLFTKRWFRILFKGFLVLLFAVLIFAKIAVKPFGLAYIIGLLMQFSGLLLAMHSLKLKGEEKYWWVHLLEGLFDIGIGISLLLFPDAAQLFILLLIFYWTIFSWIYNKQFEKVIRTRFFNFIFISLSILIIILLITYVFYIPGIERSDKILLMGGGALILGVNLINVAIGVRKDKKVSQSDEIID